MTANSWIFTDFDSLSLCIANKPYIVDSSNPNWEAILEALKAENFEAIPGLINQAKVLEEFTETATEGYANIEVNTEYGTIVYNGEPVAGVIVDHIFRMKDQGFDIKPMVRFLDNLLSNPSKRAVDELYGFLQYGKMPITEDGCFVAYKRVRNDYMSVHDGKTDNRIGSRPSMPRNLVNENSNETCSTGLHFCSHEYLKSFSGERVVVLKVNPRDVVSIPSDYNNTKGRACAYEVVGELTPDQVKEAMSGNVFVDAVHNGSAPAAKPAPVKGPKPSKGMFAFGYTRGFAAANAGEDYAIDWPAGLTGGQFDVYDDGYDQGYCDGADQNDQRYVFTGEIPTGQATDLPADQQLRESDGVDAYTLIARRNNAGLNSVADFRQGYKVGYADGRAGNAPITVLFVGDRSSNFDAGYDEGFKDGKGHKIKRFV